MNSFAEENYLKAIYKVMETGEEEVSTNSIAERLNTKPASVTDMLKKLADKKLIHYIKYQGVTLTPQGKKIAISIIRKHRLWEVFLVDKLKFKWDEVHDIAEQLEHINSEELVEKLDEFLGFPKSDPHGDPIPDVNGKFSLKKSKVLSTLTKGQKGIMTGVVDHSSSFLQYLDKMDISLGSVFSLVETVPYDRSLIVMVNGRKHFLSNDVSKNILVSLKNED